MFGHSIFGAPERIRTFNLVFRRDTLYPVELQEQRTMVPLVGFKPTTCRLRGGCSITELQRRKNWRSERDSNPRACMCRPPTFQAGAFDRSAITPCIS